MIIWVNEMQETCKVIDNKYTHFWTNGVIFSQHNLFILPLTATPFCCYYRYYYCCYRSNDFQYNPGWVTLATLGCFFHGTWLNILIFWRRRFALFCLAHTSIWQPYTAKFQNDLSILTLNLICLRISHEASFKLYILQHQQCYRDWHNWLNIMVTDLDYGVNFQGSSKTQLLSILQSISLYRCKSCS